MHESAHDSLFGSPLPEVAYTGDGFAYYPRLDRWELRRFDNKFVIRFHSLHEIFSSSLIHNLKKVALERLVYLSPRTVEIDIARMRRFARSGVFRAPCQQIKSSHVMSYRALLAVNDQHYLTHVNAFLKKWIELGYSGVSPDVADLLEETKTRGNKKGNAVRTMDPKRGPFSELELRGILDASARAYALGECSLDDFVLLHLMVAIGARPGQLAALKCRDFRETRDKHGLPSWTLEVPRLKQRGRAPRKDFIERPVIKHVARLLKSWIAAVGDMQELAPIPPADRPLFPTRARVQSQPDMHMHATATELGDRLKAMVERLGVISERTGEPINVNTLRFRYTLGTRAGEEGYGERVIASMLDHTDTQNVQVYVGRSSSIIERLDRAVALRLGPIAQAFMGTLVAEEQTAKRGGDPAARITNDALKGIGTCGHYGFCAELAPIACYTCVNFQPWVNAPHENLMNRLVEERERLLAQGIDERIAAVNDRTLLAIGDVIVRCKAHAAYKGGSV